MPKRNLKDMVVVITGASAGIGRQLATDLAARGSRLVLAARRIDKLEQLNAELGGSHLVVPCDVSQTADCERLIKSAVDRFGRIDTLVLNAGFGIYKRVAQTTPEDSRRIFATNVFGTTDCLFHALPILKAQGLRDGYRAQILIVSSVVARRGIPFLGMYSATKAAQLSLAEALRSELAPLKIAVTTLHPIQTLTEFGKVAAETGEIKWPRAPMEQTADHVSRRTIAAITSPRPEIWPSRLSRIAFGLNAFAPSLVDRLVARYRRQVERDNPSIGES